MCLEDNDYLMADADVVHFRFNIYQKASVKSVAEPVSEIVPKEFDYPALRGRTRQVITLYSRSS